MQASLKKIKRKIPDEVRKFCYERDDESCQWEGCGSSRKNGDVINLHHILPEQFGGKETPSNLVTLCDIHHKNMHIEFHAFYPDSMNVLFKMQRSTRLTLSRIKKVFRIDDGYDLRPGLEFLTKYKKFRIGQLAAIRAAMAGQDVLFVTPTGSGKSACYQLPGLYADKPSLVISPLKSLMKDQVESIWSKKIPTTYINSDLSSAEKTKRFEFIKKQLYKFIFVAPERFESLDPKTEYLYSEYSYLVIDEAHEIEMWGMAFRPSYKKLGELRGRLNNPPIIALTATASKETQSNILQSLNIPQAKVIVTGFLRDNIYINIHRVGEDDGNGGLNVGKLEYIRRLIEKNQKDKILIFAPTIKGGEEARSYLVGKGINVSFFHGKLPTKEKMEIQNRFSGLEEPSSRILISTSAFGMGIDIPNIRHVVHLAPALSLTDYVQQIGRAGRDNRPSFAHLLYQPENDELLRFMATLPLKENGFKERHGYTDRDIEKVREKLLSQVEDMLEFIKVPRGKEWDHILNYFGETRLSSWQRYGELTINVLLVISLAALILGIIGKITK